MTRFLSFLQNRLVVVMPVTMAIAMLLGVSWNGAGALKGLVLPLTFLMVYPTTVGLDYSLLLRRGDGRLQTTTLVINFLVIPLVAFTLGKLLFPNSPAAQVGLLLAGLLPTSGMTLSWTSMTKGNVPAAVKMALAGLILGSLLTPLYVRALFGAAIRVPVFLMLGQVVLVVFVPLLAGYATRKWLSKRWGTKLQVRVKESVAPFGTLGVLGVVFVAVATKAQDLAANPLLLVQYAIPLVLLYGANFFLVTLLGRIFFSRGDAIALVYGTALRNLSIALAIALNSFKDYGAEIGILLALAFILQTQAAAWHAKWVDRWFGSDRGAVSSTT